MQQTFLPRLGAMMRYEALMQLRRGSTLVIFLFTLVTLFGMAALTAQPAQNAQANTLRVITMEPHDDGGALVTYRDTRTGATTSEVWDAARLAALPSWIMDVDPVEVVNTTNLMIILGMSLVVVGIGIAMMTAEIIPLDRQYRMRELLDALPISRALYLGGKVAGLSIGLLIVLIGAAVIFAAAAPALLNGAFNVSAYVRLWGFVLLPTALLTGAFSVVAASGMKGRRAAVLLSLATLPLLVVVFSRTFVAVMFFVVRAGGSTAGLPPTESFDQLITLSIDDALSGVLMFAAGVALVWLAAWMHQRRKFA